MNKGWAWIGALAASGVAAGAVAPGLAQAAPPFVEAVTQLPRTARPVHYVLRIEPDAKALTFKGRAAITVDLLSPATSIMLNGASLSFGAVRVVDAAGKVTALVTSVDAASETVTFTAPAPLAAGRYTLEADYAGLIQTQANGLFALDYADPKGANKRALFTQFEPGDARRMFPGWDEPNYKASFDITLVTPADEMPVSNMPVTASTPLGDGRIAHSFARTPIMSTYLVFVGSGAFDRITTTAGKTEVGVIMGRGNADKARYALEASAQVLPFYEEYFAQPFPLPKLDNVAGPGQSQFFSAMENWGAIFSFEKALLLDPANTTEAQRQGIYSIAAHEIAHQWFGDLVTMRWWDDLWLNEGFASWMAGKTTAHFNPEWDSKLDAVADRERAMALDGYATTHAVVQSVKTVEQANQAFDAITYRKGKAIISMLEGYAGADVWRTGLRTYMARHAYGNTETGDLWRAVEEAGAKDLLSIARQYTSQPGVPLVRVSGQCRKGLTALTLTQSEFSLDAKARADRAPLRWTVPVAVQAAGASPDTVMLDKPKVSASVAGCGPVVVGAGQNGYFRTLYAAPALDALRSSFATLAPIDQLGLLADGEALSRGGYQPMGAVLGLIDAIPADANPRVLQSGIEKLTQYYNLMGRDGVTRTRIADRAKARYAPMLAQLGLEGKAGETPPVAVLRATLIEKLGWMGEPSVVAEGKRLLARLDADPKAMDGPLKSVWMSVIAANADRATWEVMLGHARREKGQIARSNWYRLLGEARDPSLARATFDLALTPEPGATLSAAMIEQIALGHSEAVIRWTLDKIDLVESFVDGPSRSRYLASLADGVRDPAIIPLLEDYARTRLTPESRKPIDAAQTRIRTRAKGDPKIRKAVKAWFARG